MNISRVNIPSTQTLLFIENNKLIKSQSRFLSTTADDNCEIDKCITFYKRLFLLTHIIICKNKPVFNIGRNEIKISLSCSNPRFNSCMWCQSLTSWRPPVAGCVVLLLCNSEIMSSNATKGQIQGKINQNNIQVPVQS